MRRRKDIASLLRNVERPSERKTVMGITSSVSKDGRIINSKTTADGEVRDLSFALPYGISSSGMDDMKVQVIINDNKNNVVVGVVNNRRPEVKPGCIKIYDKSGSLISLNGDESMDVSTISGAKISINKNGDINIESKAFVKINSAEDVDINSSVSVNINSSANVNINGGGTINITGEAVNINGKVSINGKEIT